MKQDETKVLSAYPDEQEKLDKIAKEQKLLCCEIAELVKSKGFDAEVNFYSDTTLCVKFIK